MGIVNGRRSVTAKTALLLAKVLRIPVRELTLPPPLPCVTQLHFADARIIPNTYARHSACIPQHEARSILTCGLTREVWTVKDQAIARRFFTPRMLAGLTVIGTLALAAPAWASSVAGSPASDGSANSNALPSNPHPASAAPGAACGCAVSSAARPAGARATLPAASGGASRDGHARAGGNARATQASSATRGGQTHFARSSHSR
jgi:hypothetical protein